MKIDVPYIALLMQNAVECGHSVERLQKSRSRFMVHFRFRWLIAAVAMAVVVALLMQPDGRGDSGRSAAERERNWEIEDLSRVTVSLGGGVTMDFVLIPAGTFLMGSPKEEKQRSEDEGPQHEVRITRSFYLGKYEVTQEQYKQIVGSNPS
jgi:formylglycine-generating enzyme required for sulfatase activity